MNRRSLSLAVACLCAGVLPLSLMAQTMEGMPFTYVPISTGGTVPVICANADPVYFTDDNNGGDNFQSPYTNQNHTITLCPDESDASLALDFLVFSLATGQSAIDNDVLYIYDGEDVDAPLLASGQENQLEGVTVTASDANISGCITVEFVVNSGALGANPGWVALVTCATSCAHPTASIAVSSPASISGNSGAVGLCIEESVTMDASGSMPGMSGAALESLIWNWGDGTTESVSVLEGFERSHEYLHPGTYDVSLVVQDALNCSSLNLAQVEVVASTKPLFNSVVSSPLCLNTTGQLDGTPVESVPWTFQPTFGVSENTTLSDITGVIFPSEIVVDAFAPGETLEDCSQLETITANMFHEYVGDLTISVTCPNGTEVVLLENPSPSGGGGIQGADPNDCNLNASGMQEDLNLYRLGASVTEGYDYAWNMDALHVIDGVDNPHTVPNDETAQTGLILPETYLPCGNFCDFEGCPLNGVWTFNVLDQWPLGDGMLFGWNLAFNPAIAPDITTTQPTIGQGADSSFWHVVGDISVPLTSEVDGVEAVDSDGNVVDVLFETPGNYEFGFHAINNVGCASDTTVVIEVIASSNEALSAGPDLGYCDGPIQLLGSFEAVNSGGCDESSGIGQHCMGSNEDASFAFCPDVPGDGTMMSLRLMGGELELGTDVLTVFDGADEASAVLATLTGDVAGQTFTATNPSGCLFMTLTSDGSCDCMSDDECDFGPVQWCAHCGESPVGCDYNFMWEPAEMLDDPTLLQPTLLSFDGNPLTLVLTMSNEASDVCTATDTVMVTSGLDVLLEIGQASCAGNDGEAILSISSNADETESPIEIRLHALSDDSPLDVVMWTGQEVVFDGLTPGEYQIVVSNALGCTRTEGFTIDEPEIIFDDENVLDHIEVRLESSPTQFLDALGLPEVVTHSNGQEFPLQSWIDLQGTNLFDWEDGTVDGVAIEGCSDAFLRILRDANEADVSDVVSWQWGGGAVIGDDFSSAVQTVVLAPGEVEVIVPLVIVADSIEEGVEIVTVEYGYVDACGGNVWKNSRMVILDAISMQTDPGILACDNGKGGQFAEFNNIEGFGPFMYQWGEPPLSPSDPWLDLAGLNFSQEIALVDSNGQSLSNGLFQLNLMDQCDQVSTHSLSIAQPAMYDAEFCVDTTVSFPMVNPHVPISDLLLDDTSVLTSDILLDTVAVHASLSNGGWFLDSVSTGVFDWSGTITLVDTCGQTSSAVWQISEHPCADGCTQIEACNYQGEASTDDGSCVFPGDECEGVDGSFDSGILNEDCECDEAVVEIVEVVVDLRVAPNPSNGEVWISSNLQSGLLVCRSVDGRVVHQEELKHLDAGAEINLSLGSGLYLMELTSGNQRAIARVVIER